MSFERPILAMSGRKVVENPEDRGSSRKQQQVKSRLARFCAVESGKSWAEEVHHSRLSLTFHTFLQRVIGRRQKAEGGESVQVMRMTCW